MRGNLRLEVLDPLLTEYLVGGGAEGMSIGEGLVREARVGERLDDLLPILLVGLCQTFVLRGAVVVRHLGVEAICD